MAYEQDMRSFKGNRLNEQARVFGVHPLLILLVPLFVMIPYTIVKTAIVVIGILGIFLSIKGMTKDEFKRLCKSKFKRTRIIRSSCPPNFQDIKKI